MTPSKRRPDMIMRLFHVHAKKGCAQELLEKFETTSADVVRNEPGNRGYFFGQDITIEDDVLVFASFWADLDAVKQRFGADWQKSFLPEGYEDLIEDCSVTHFNIGSGWFVRAEQDM